MNLTSQMVVQEFNDALVEFIQEQRMTFPKALRYQGRLLAKRLIDFTPPKTRSQGRKRVAKDISRIFLALKKAADVEARFQIVGGEEAVRIFATKEGTVYGVDRRLYRPDATFAEMSAHHQSNRTSRGRVTEAGSRTRDVGRWKFLDVMVVPSDKLVDYIRAVQDRVGQAKGSWAAAYIALGGRPSAWISVHARVAGFVEDRADDQVNAFIRIVNQSEWAKGGDEDRIVENAIRSRARDIVAAMAKAQADAARNADLN